jgi:hypothetical protein
MNVPSWSTHQSILLVQTGAMVFIAALVGSSLLEPSAWLLHALQGAIYLAIILLINKHLPAGLGAALALALPWNIANLFVTGFAREGIEALATAARTGHLTRIAFVLVLVGVIGHFLMIIGAAWHLVIQRLIGRQWLQFAAGAIGAFAALVAIFPLRHHRLPLPLDVGQAAVSPDSSAGH